jgi:8-oxo-dGTP diphosphatase
MGDHVGAKIAVICDGEVIAYQRDDFAHIPYPGQWDLPGGERDAGDATALACALRELEEEFGLRLAEDRIMYACDYTGNRGRTAFFVAEMSAAERDAIVFGEEGQRWTMMPVAEFINRMDAVDDLREQLRLWKAAAN